MLVWWNVRIDWCFLLLQENLLLTEQDMPFWIITGITCSSRRNWEWCLHSGQLRRCRGWDRFSVLLGSSSSLGGKLFAYCVWVSHNTGLAGSDPKDDQTLTPSNNGDTRHTRTVSNLDMLTFSTSVVDFFVFSVSVDTFLAPVLTERLPECSVVEIWGLGTWPLLAPSRGGDSCVFVAWLRVHSRGSISSLVSVLIPATKTELFTSRLTPLLVISSAVLSPPRSIHLIMCGCIHLIVFLPFLSLFSLFRITWSQSFRYSGSIHCGEVDLCLCFGNLALCRAYKHTAWPPKTRQKDIHQSSDLETHQCSLFMAILFKSREEEMRVASY